MAAVVAIGDSAVGESVKSDGVAWDVVAVEHDGDDGVRPVFADERGDGRGRRRCGDLALHLIVDNYATHKHPQVKRWLGRHVHFTPTPSSWRNLVERWFRDLTDQRIRRDSFEHVPRLIDLIEGYIAQSNQNPQIFVWTASAEGILAKIAKCKEALDALPRRPCVGAPAKSAGAEVSIDS